MCENCFRLESIFALFTHVGDICQVVGGNVKGDTVSHLFRVLFSHSVSSTWRFSTWTDSKRDDPDGFFDTTRFPRLHFFDNI